jgi:hypothetical protein
MFFFLLTHKMFFTRIKIRVCCTWKIGNIYLKITQIFCWNVQSKIIQILQLSSQNIFFYEISIFNWKNHTPTSRWMVVSSLGYSVILELFTLLKIKMKKQNETQKLINKNKKSLLYLDIHSYVLSEQIKNKNVFFRWPRICFS